MNLVTADSADASKFVVHTTQPPDKGKANEAIVKLLAEHFRVPQSRVTLVTGLTSRTKMFDIDVEPNPPNQ